MTQTHAENTMTDTKIKIASFICGAAVMIIQFAAIRMLAPFVGSAFYIWAVVIGIMLIAMSFGYQYGGKLADRKLNVKTLSRLIAIAGALVILAALIGDKALAAATENFPIGKTDLSIMATAIFFTVPSFLLGATSPYSVKLLLKNIESTGRTSGGLYAISNAGSILGTFLGGFLVVPMLNAAPAMALSGAMLILTATAILSSPIRNSKPLTCAIIIMAALTVPLTSIYTDIFEGIIERYDSRYGTIIISDRKLAENTDIVRHMQIDDNTASTMRLNSDELFYEYNKAYDLAFEINPEARMILLFGGAGGTYPMHFVNMFDEPDRTIDIVEINPTVTRMAERYFGFEPGHERITVYHQDARTFLNNNQAKYDVIIDDAFGSDLVPPFQLITVEAFQKVYDSLTDDGIFMLNVLDGLEGNFSDLFKAVYHTINQVFPEIIVTLPEQPDDLETVRCIIIIAAKQPIGIEITDPPVYDVIPERTIILTDDFAPVEFISKRWHDTATSYAIRQTAAAEDMPENTLKVEANP